MVESVTRFFVTFVGGKGMSTNQGGVRGGKE